MKRFAIIAVLLLAGCSVNKAPTPAADDTDGAIIERLTAIEARLTALEQHEPQPPPPITGKWQQLSHDAGVKSAHLRARLYRDLAAAGIEGAKAKEEWLRPRLVMGETAIFNEIRKALAAEFENGYDDSRHNQIMLEQAEGYELVR